MSLAILTESTFDWVETARRYLKLIQLGFRLRESVFQFRRWPRMRRADVDFAASYSESSFVFSDNGESRSSSPERKSRDGQIGVWPGTTEKLIRPRPEGFTHCQLSGC